MKDVVDNVLRVPAFGFTGYNPKASVRDLIPAETHRQPKSVRRTFAVEHSDQKKFVPGSPMYHSEHNWEKSPSTKTAKFFVTKRRTIADEIEHKSTFKEKSVPGCGDYKHDAAWKFT